MSRREARRTLARAEHGRGAAVLGRGVDRLATSPAPTSTSSAGLFEAWSLASARHWPNRADWLTEQASRASVDELDRLVKAEVRRRAGGRRPQPARTPAPGCAGAHLDRRRRHVVPPRPLRPSHRAPPLPPTRGHRRPALRRAGCRPHAPSHPTERQHYLRAHALIALLDGEAANLGAIRDRRGRRHHRDRRAGRGLGAPCRAPPPAPGRPLPGRRRVAGRRPQRRRSSTPPGGSTSGGPPASRTAPSAEPCAPSTRPAASRAATVSYDWCKLHHVAWWERGGRTDLANLLPLCTAHHRAVHESGWRLTHRS